MNSAVPLVSSASQQVSVCAVVLKWTAWIQHEISTFNRADSLKTARIQVQSVRRSLIDLKLVRLGYVKACADTESSCHVKAKWNLAHSQVKSSRALLSQEDYTTKVSNLSRRRKSLCVHVNISTEYTISATNASLQCTNLTINTVPKMKPNQLVVHKNMSFDQQ